MRHNVKKKRLGRSTAQRKALLRSLLTALVENGKIETTLSRAKAVASAFDELVATVRNQPVEREQIRRAKEMLYTESSQRKLIGEYMPRFKNTSGLTSVTKLGPRGGDGAEVAHVNILLAD